jgi:hypothetical protein
MQGFLLCAASVAVLVGLVAWVEAARPQRRGQGGRWPGFRQQVWAGPTQAARTTH